MSPANIPVGLRGRPIEKNGPTPGKMLDTAFGSLISSGLTNCSPAKANTFIEGSRLVRVQPGYLPFSPFPALHPGQHDFHARPGLLPHPELRLHPSTKKVGGSSHGRR